MRGSGDSDGLYYDEYEKQEQDDCCDVINWISQQNWCTGNVGKLCLTLKREVEGREPPMLEEREGTVIAKMSGTRKNSQTFCNTALHFLQ